VAERDFSEPIPVSGPSEIAQLTQAFNRMATRLGELDQMKDAFFTAVSHDLRTPLAAIRWSADLLQTGALGPLTPKQARLTETIQSSSRRLLALVGQILELSRLRAGRLALDVRLLDLRHVIAEAVDEIRPLAEQGQLTLHVDIPAELPRVPADTERIYQVLANLLGNAVRFTPPGGRVTVQAVADESEVTIRVIDTGVGIPAELLPKIFDPFEQAHAGRGGSGIGLSVVRALVEAHRGRVTIQSEEGHGATFAFSLPLMADDDARIEPPDVASVAGLQGRG
jgi:signal transduction histidine kinase